MVFHNIPILSVRNLSMQNNMPVGSKQELPQGALEQLREFFTAMRVGVGIGQGLASFNVKKLREVGRITTEAGGVVHMSVNIPEIKAIKLKKVNVKGATVTDFQTGIMLLKEDDQDGSSLHKGITEQSAPELIGASGERWKIMHDVVKGPLNQTEVKKYIPAIQKSVIELVNKWKNGSEINFSKEINLFAIRVLFDNLFGYKNISDTRLGEISKLIDDLQEHLRKKSMDLGYKNSVQKNGNPQEIIKAEQDLENLADELIAANKDSTEKNLLVYMVQALLNETISKAAFVEVLKEFIIAGHRTLANTTSWIAIDLWKNKDTGLLDEAYNLFKSSSVEEIADSKSRYPAAKVLRDIESRYAQTIIFFRQAVQDIELSNGEKFSKGEHILVMLQDILDNLTAAFKEAQERGDKTEMEKLTDLMNSISIFSAGVRKCLGDYYAQVVIATFYKTLAEEGIELEFTQEPRIEMPAGILTPTGPAVERVIVHRPEELPVAMEG